MMRTIGRLPVTAHLRVGDLRDRPFLRGVVPELASNGLILLNLVGLEERAIHLDAEAGRAGKLKRAV